MEIMSLCNLADALRESTDAWGDSFRYYGGTALVNLLWEGAFGIGWRRPFFYVRFIKWCGLCYLCRYSSLCPILSQRLNRLGVGALPSLLLGLFYSYFACGCMVSAVLATEFALSLPLLSETAPWGCF